MILVLLYLFKSITVQVTYNLKLLIPSNIEIPYVLIGSLRLLTKMYST